MNPLNLFILVSQLSLGLYVAASPSTANPDPETFCDRSKTYAGRKFNLYTSTDYYTDRLMISDDGRVQDGRNDGYVLTAKFAEKPTGSEPYPWYGNLQAMDANNKWSQYGYLLSRPEISGGGYNLMFKVPEKIQPPETRWKSGVTFGFDCVGGRPILIVKNLANSQVTGCDVKGGGLNVCFPYIIMSKTVLLMF
jgi:hypothetical protein